jgi:phage tail sheath protein FI
MATLSYPGVYVEEISSGVRPLEAASTSTAAFVGLTEMGPAEATRVTNWTEFQRLYGSFITDGFLTHSVFQYFNNGGRQCYIVRVVRSDAATASVTVQNRAAAPVAGMTFSARNSGAWGNSLLLTIDDGTLDPGSEFRVSVRRQEDPDVVSGNFRETAPLETFDNLSTDPDAPNFVTTVLTQDSSLIDVQVLSANTSTQRGLHRAGTGAALPLNANVSFQINLDGDGYQVVTLPAAAGTATALGDVATAIQTAVTGLTKKRSSTSATAFTGFTCTVEGTGNQARLLLQSGTNTAASSVGVQPATSNDATSQLRLGAGNGGRSESGAAVRRPARIDALQVGDATVAGVVTGATLGDEGKAVISETTFSNAFPRLDAISDVSLLAVPGEGTTAMFDLGAAYCANRPLKDMFYIGEVASHDDTAAEAAAFRAKLTTANSYGALYFPWVTALDPAGRSGQPILLPPAGFVAGLYARTDASRGVWKAPAGVAASLNGVVGLAAELSDVQHGNLNPLGVDVIRRFPGAGVVSFGARTVTSDPEWRYVPVRRTAIMLRVSVYNGIQWAVFEPNDETLWSQLRLNIGAFMMSLFRQGAFQGATPSQAFFVKCDGETTTQADIDAGVVNVLLGFAPLKPAEFVVVRISQKAGLATG